ncbi:MAG: TIGR02996 domain-containing protein [Gemmataceae bacterium]
MARKNAAPAPSWASDPQYQAFESDLVAHPDDDTPRLVLADWLEEHGDGHAAARAEFIRVQVELARLGKDDPGHDELRRREEVLLAAHRDHWLGPLAGVVTDAVWVRGFPQRMKLGVRAFMDNADEIFRQAPVLHLQLLRINQTKMTMDELAACPHFGKLRGLSLPGSQIGDTKLAALLRNADLRHADTLDLSGTGAREDSLRAIATGQFPGLKGLNLSGNVMEFVVQQLFRDDVPFSLTHLNLGGSGLNSQDLEALFGWAGLAAVEELTLWNNRLGNAGARHLAASPYVGRLRSLDLTFSEIGMRGMQALARAQPLAGLREVRLAYNNILSAGLEALLSASFAGNLRSLELNENGLGDAGAELLAAWPGLGRVRTLELRGNRLTSAGVQALCSSPHLGGLTTLVLSNNPIGDTGAQALAGCPGLSGLRRLDLSFGELHDAGVEALLDSPRLSHLARLELEYNSLSPAVLRRCKARFHRGG